MRKAYNIIILLLVSTTIFAQQTSVFKADSLFNIGVELYLQNEYDKSIITIDEAASIFNSLGDAYIERYCSCLEMNALCYFDKECFSTAAEYYKTVLSLQKFSLQKESSEYVSTINKIAICYEKLGKFDEAIEFYNRVAQVTIPYIVNNNNDLEKLSLILKLGIFYKDGGNYYKAIGFFQEILNENKSVHENNVLEYAIAQNYCGECYFELGEYSKAIECYANTIGVVGFNNDDLLLEIAKALNGTGCCYEAIGDYSQAIDNYYKSKEIIKSILGDDNLYISWPLMNIGVCYNDLGDFQKAIEYESEALKIRELTIGSNDTDYAKALNNLGVCYENLGQFESAKNCFIKSLEIFLANSSRETADYAWAVNNLGACYGYTEDFEKAIEYLSEAAEIRKNIIGEYHPDYAWSLYYLGLCYMNLGEYDIAMSYLRETLTIRKTCLGIYNQDYALALRYLSLCYLFTNDYDNFIEYHSHYLQILRKIVIKDSAYLSSSLRNSYWSFFKDDLLSIFPYYAYHLSSSRIILRHAYDCLLLGKGFLLNAETEARNTILESNDTEIQNLYSLYIKERQQLSQEYEKPSFDHGIVIDSLSAVCEHYELELMKRSKVFENYKRNLDIMWADVQSKLGRRDIAIEFMEVPISIDSTMYCALTLKKGYDSPHYVELFNANDLKKLASKYSRPDLIYKSSQLYELVWKPLEKELSGVKNIYFAPAGELHQVAIEYANDGKKTVFEKWNTHRLSSTRQLAIDKEKRKTKSASVFGGFDYESSQEDLEADIRIYDLSSSANDVGRAIKVESIIRGSHSDNGEFFGKLDNTLEEALDISSTLTRAGVKNQLKTGKAGTEAAFKSMSGKDNSIIHIATHGFYWTRSEAQRKAQNTGLGFLREFDSENGRIKEDEALTRSGLAFSGANNAMKKDYVYMNDVEDGILTAKEIALMDLRGTDLVTLSACQTGLGEVSGEGVFGLQRGFKKAGVNSILMSLWEVDDEATRLLMTTFYENLLSGKSKSESLKLAQNKVRSKDGYNEPYYWASFILLDGIY